MDATPAMFADVSVLVCLVRMCLFICHRCFALLRSPCYLFVLDICIIVFCRILFDLLLSFRCDFVIRFLCFISHFRFYLAFVLLYLFTGLFKLSRISFPAAGVRFEDGLRWAESWII